MIDINRNNYEKYFLDFIEGNMNSFDKDMLMSFLNQNPDLKQELDMFEESLVFEESILFDKKNLLKRESILSELTDNNFDELCIARMENDLTLKQQNDFDEYISKNVQKGKEYALYKFAKAEADQAIIFDKKESLRKKTRATVFSRNYTIISLAASIIIVIAIYLFLPKSEESIELTVAEVELKETKVTEKAIESIDHEITNSQKLEKIAKLAEKQIATQKEVKVDLNTIESNNNKKRETIEIEKLKAIEVNYNFNIAEQKGNIKYIVTDPINTELPNNDYISFKTYMASTINKRILKKDNKRKIEFFDIAQAGINGINKLTGSKMKLEKVYDKNGKHDRTEFNSRLIAFSAPVKKD